MKFYEKFYNSNFDELLTYYPDFYKNVYEMIEILKVFGSLSDDLENKIQQAFLNNFILTADSDTIKLWENILDISYTEKLSLQQRRRVIIGYLSGGKHIGEPEIKNIISNYSDKLSNVDFLNGVIKIIIYGEIFDEYNLLNTLLQKIPAHLKLDLNIHINKKFRHVIDFLQVGFICSNSSGQPPDKKHFSGKLSSSGGIFCRTHTKSNLIQL